MIIDNRKLPYLGTILTILTNVDLTDDLSDVFELLSVILSNEKNFKLYMLNFGF